MRRTVPLEYDPVVHGYSVASVNKYDITSIKDVAKILKWIRHEDRSEEFAKEFSKKLLAFDIFMRKKLESEGVYIKGKITAEKLVKKGLVKSQYYGK